MKAILIHKIKICLVSLLFGLLLIGQLKAQTRFSKNAVLEDLEFLRISLEQTHYDLYAYTPKSEFIDNYLHVKQTIKKDSFSLLETTTLFQRVISKVNNGHTEIGFPGTSYGQYAYSGGTIFPLEIAFENGKALIRKNWSNNNNIQIGSEVLRINETSISEILSDIYPLVSAERPYFKNAKIELFSFPRLYWQLYGEQESFEIAVALDGDVETHTVDAVDLIQGFEMKRTEIFNSGRELKFIDGFAYLNPGNFNGDETKFKKFIDSAFTQIKANKNTNLIIDLRNNLGGNDSFSDYLVSYIADKPFKWHSKFYVKTSKILKEQSRKNNDTTQIYFKEILNHKNGESYEFVFDEYPPQPREKRFPGKVYVLVNRQSHSQAAVTAAQIQDNGFATIVGEETGEYPTLFASQFQYPLPNTGITINVSKGYSIRLNGSTKKEGVVPDIIIQDHLLDEKDEILNGLLHKIE